MFEPDKSKKSNVNILFTKMAVNSSRNWNNNWIDCSSRAELKDRYSGTDEDWFLL